MLDRAPSVMITSNRNELKLYQGNVVYLNNGDNFELRFFNPLQEKIGVEILFNGVKKGDSYLVLNPGQDIILDRFLDEQKKMLFETYVVNANNAEAVKAIEKNGIITFNFYKESYRMNYVTPQVNVNYNFPPKPPKPYKVKKGKKIQYYSSGSYGISGTSGMAGVSGISGSGGGGTTTNTFYSNNTNVYNTPGVYTTQTDFSWCSSNLTLSSLGIDNTNPDTSFRVTSASFNPLETGRVESGDLSNQTLKTVNAQFASTPFHTVTYQILPYSAMNQTIGEVRQYCSCGYRIRKDSWIYCPKCGHKLD